MENSEQIGPVAESEKFYDDLLEKAIATIPESGAVMVLGPLFILRPTSENLLQFEKVQKDLEEKGNVVFDQRKFLDIVLQKAPFRYEIKFPVFFKKLIESGKITACYLLDDWEKSEGVKEEAMYCKSANVPIFKV